MKYTHTGIDTVVKHVDTVVSTTDKVIDPVRKSVVKRFPIFFGLLVTFGVASMIHGIERILDDIAWFNERPYLILLTGIGILVFTGRLYKKLE